MKESAWEMFRRLNKNGMKVGVWTKIIPEKYHSDYTNSLTIIKWICLCPEQEAIEIMQEIEKELNNESI